MSNTATNVATSVGVDDIGLDVLDAQNPDVGPAVLRKRRELHLSDHVLSAYAGIYEVTPTFSITISVRNGQLLATATDQGPFEIFAEGRDRFFYKAADIQIVFKSDIPGKITGLVVHQSGREIPAKRVL